MEEHSFSKQHGEQPETGSKIVLSTYEWRESISRVKWPPRNSPGPLLLMGQGAAGCHLQPARAPHGGPEPRG